MSDYEAIDTHLAAEVVDAAIALLDSGKPLLARNLLTTLHERLLQDDGMHHKACAAEVCGDHFVTQ
jgi:hypothetical protein